MLPILLTLLLLCSSSSHAASVRGHPLVFSTDAADRRSLLTSEEEGERGRIWYVKSGSMPPPGFVAHEAVAPGVYLARGDASADLPRGEWTPEMKYAKDMRTSAPPKFPAFGVQVRTDSLFFEFEGCVTSAAGPGRFHVKCPEAGDNLQRLARDSRVLWISPIPLIRPTSYESRRLFFGENYAYNGSGTRIAVSDTGLDFKHCAFYEGSDPPLGSINSNRQKVVGIVKTPGGDYIALTGAHGTATAGVAAGYACLGETGVAPQAQVYFLDASDNDESLYIPSNLESYIQSSGATVHSASWGTYTGGVYDDTDSRFDTMQRDMPTVCQVRPAGNDGPTGVVGATSKSGLVVGACLSRAEAYPSMSPTQRNQQPELYSHTSQIDFSSRGPAADGRLYPQICAPGFQVRVPYAVRPSYSNHADYAYASGTSFATPAIAGLISNLQQRWKATHGGALPNCALLEAALMAHAVEPTRVVYQSSNRLEVLPNAPEITTMGTPVLDFARWTDVDGLSVASTDRQALCFENTDTEPWTIVLRWTDVPAVDGSDAPLINDLDMVLVGATGEVRVVNDGINSFEKVQEWPAQHTRIIVMAYDGVSTFGAQPFSLHIRGKATKVPCASSLLPSEYSNCTHGSVVVDSWLGSASCDFQTCPSNTCGADCARTCDLSRPCAPTNGGSGYYEQDTETCRPAACPAYTFVSDTECVCKLGSAKPCGEDQMAHCKTDGTFAACAANSGTGSIVVASDAASFPRPSLLLLFFPLLFFLIR